MGWVSEQVRYKEERDRIEQKEHWFLQQKLSEQSEDFYCHWDQLEEVAKLIDEMIHNRELKENIPVVMYFYQSDFPVEGIATIVAILRDDGFVYFGKGELFATLGLGGRTKNSQVELYEQYKDQINAYIKGAEK